MEELLTKGLFITFEGPDASGKTTQIKLLSSFLKRKGLEVLVTREPGGTDIGEKIRKILLDKKHYSMEYKTEALLFLASRAEHTSKVIKPALKEGRIVISDRFFDSTVVYQGIARGLGKEKIIDMSLWATGGLVPDITFLLLIGVSGGEERIRLNNKKKDRIEIEEDLFKQKILQGYMEIARENSSRIVVIDGEESVSRIFERIRSKVEEVLARKGIRI